MNFLSPLEELWPRRALLRTRLLEQFFSRMKLGPSPEGSCLEPEPPRWLFCKLLRRRDLVLEKGMLVALGARGGWVCIFSFSSGFCWLIFPLSASVYSSCSNRRRFGWMGLSIFGIVPSGWAWVWGLCSKLLLSILASWPSSASSSYDFLNLVYIDMAYSLCAGSGDSIPPIPFGLVCSFGVWDDNSAATMLAFSW